LNNQPATFAKYIEDKYYDDIFYKLKNYIFNNNDKLNLYTKEMPDPSYTELDAFHVMGITFHEAPDDHITFQASVQADISIHGKRRNDYEDDMLDRWFLFSFSAVLRNGLSNVRITGLEEYSQQRFNSEDALTKFLVPYIYAKDLDEHAERFLKIYCPRVLETPMPLPVNEVVEAMGLTVYKAPLPGGVFGRTYFTNATVEVYDDRGNVVEREITPGTILHDPTEVFMRNIGSMNNTIIHECVHWDKHYKFFELQKLLNTEIYSISCAVVENYNRKSNGLVNELEWIEWQANALAPRILMPASTTRRKLNGIMIELYNSFPNTRSGELMQLAISKLADFFNVSTFAAKLRAIDLGFDQAAGVFNYVDGKYFPPISYKKGALKKDQTYIVDFNNAVVETTMNQELSIALQAGHFVHANGLFVINDSKYVKINERSEAELTDYALEHVDECCLVFNRKTRISNSYDDSFYRYCFLCRDANSESFVEATCELYVDNNEDIAKRAAEMSKIRDEADRIREIMASLPSTFSGSLDAHIKRRGYTNEQMEERCEISERRIRDLRNKDDINVELPAVLSLCIGLNLHPVFSFDLLNKAGHNITAKYSPENLVYIYLINNHHMETLSMWNEKLEEARITQHLPSNRKNI
jgi:hypothetical protein